MVRTAAALALALVGCVAYAGEPPSPDKRKKTKLSPALDTPELRKQASAAVAARHKVPVERVSLSVLGDAGVPGHMLFRGNVTPPPGADPEDEEIISVGVVTSAGVQLDPKLSLASVIAAWGYSKKNRAVPAEQFARVVTWLDLESNSGAILYDADELGTITKRFRKHLFLPREFSGWGKGGVEWWKVGRDPPFWLIRVVFKRDGTWERTATSLWDLMQ